MTTGGTASWTRYEIEGKKYIEKSTGGTAIFYIQDTNYAIVAAASYSVNYDIGIVTFATNTVGVSYFATGVCYDINGAAADIWTQKANTVSAQFDFSTDNHSIKRSQVYQVYLKQAEYYRGFSKHGAGGNGSMRREDTDA
jgi:hypothetical protein